MFNKRFPRMPGALLDHEPSTCQTQRFPSLHFALNPRKWIWLRFQMPDCSCMATIGQLIDRSFSTIVVALKAEWNFAMSPHPSLNVVTLVPTHAGWSFLWVCWLFRKLVRLLPLLSDFLAYVFFKPRETPTVLFLSYCKYARYLHRACYVLDPRKFAWTSIWKC